jgi:hypothetical protein
LRVLRAPRIAEREHDLYLHVHVESEQLGQALRVRDRVRTSLRRPDPTRRSGCASVARCFAADRVQRGAAPGAAALPAGTTVGQGHLPRVGDGDLLAADTPRLRAGILCLRVPRAPLNHVRPPYSWWKSAKAEMRETKRNRGRGPASSYHGVAGLALSGGRPH